MGPFISASEPSHAAEGHSQGDWLRVMVLAFCGLILIAAAMHQARVREDMLARSAADARMLSDSLGQHAADTFEIADVILAGFADTLAVQPGRSLDDIFNLDTMLERQLRSTPRIRSLVAFDRFGRQFASSQPQVPDWFDLSNDAAFKEHAGDVDDGVRIGAPAKSPTTNDWLIPVTRRWTDANGAFGGIVMATIRADYFSNFYRNFNVDGEAGISLLSGDGILLSRYPMIDGILGRDASSKPWFVQTQGSTSGTFRLVSPFDGVARLHGFRRFDDIPLMVSVGIGEAHVLASWMAGCVAFMAGALLVAIGLGVGGWRLAAKLDARLVSERRWSDLAMTDALTGIRNRRAFDEIALRSWRDGSRRHRSLSLLLIDVDHFKAFNDTYGHPAGDACLKAIADALKQAVGRSSDCAARYGGEEFALLLPETGSANALTIAERIRQSILHLAIPHANSATLSVVSVSIGIATAVFEAPAAEIASLDDLVAQADRGLYRAKQDGRNQVRFEPAAEPVVAAA